MSNDIGDCSREVKVAQAGIVNKDSYVGQLEVQTKAGRWDTLKSFCETTTFHGLRNIADHNQSVARR